VRDGDDWIVNGQKVWSSGAHYSQWGMLLARSDSDVPKHRGITYFILDMSSPGIEIRPLRQMTGGAHFNEVFLTDVRVPDTDRLGDVHDGWRVAQTTLLNERASIAELIGEQQTVRALIELARAAEADGRPGASDPRVRQAIADVHIRAEVMRYIGLRIVSAFSRGAFPGPEASVAKVAIAELLRRTSNLALTLQGPAAIAAVAADGEFGDGNEDGSWASAFLAAPAVRIAGGSDEVQRNIMGERVLGLPKEPGPPRDTPFRDLPV
jgi:alkylation response protein AidB-like acyl-CoA dehydrogenase